MHPFYIHSLSILFLFLIRALRSLRYGYNKTFFFFFNDLVPKKKLYILPKVEQYKILKCDYATTPSSLKFNRLVGEYVVQFFFFSFFHYGFLDQLY